MSHGEQAVNPDPAATFGRLLRGHRLAAGLSQAALAERAGLGERAIQRLEADRNRPYRTTVEQLIDALHLSDQQAAELIAAVAPPSREEHHLRPAAGEPAGSHLRLVKADHESEPHPDQVPPASPREARAVRVPRGRLIGRAGEVDAICALILRADVGLVTLSGPGGSGKTRLAMQVAADLADQFEDGVTFVNLTLVAEAEAVPMAIVQAMDLMDLGEHPTEDRLKRHLRDRHALLVLDNFEHVLGARALVSDLLAACPRLSVLVTSRAVLRVYGEHEVPVPPLASPSDADGASLDAAALFPAVELLVERMQAVRPDFALTAENVGAVVAICRRLDGLPLAIELAAARGRMLSPEAILRRLDHRLPLLTDGPRDRPARQQTLRDAIGWSYDLLDDRERQSFRRLGVFVGGWTLDAAEALATPGADAGDQDLSAAGLAGTLDDIGSLVDKSLLVTLPDVAGEPRYGMLETIREYAVEQLQSAGELSRLRQRHADYYLDLAEQAAPALLTGEQVAWLARLGAEHANIGAALTWLSGRDDPDAARLGLRLAGSLHWYWWLGGSITEGRAWLRATLARGAADDPAAISWRARALYAAGGLAMVQGEYPVATGRLDEAVTLFRALGDRQGLGRALAYRSILDTFARDPQAARSRLIESLDLLHQVDDVWGLGLAGSNLAAVTRSLGDPDTAHHLLERYVPLARETGDRYLLGSALPKWAHVALARGEPGHAEELVREALGLFRVFNDGWWTARCINLLTVMAAERGDHVRAARLLGAADYLLHLSGARLVPTDVARSERMSAMLRVELGDAEFEATYAEGRTADVDQIVRYALDRAAE